MSATTDSAALAEALSTIDVNGFASATGDVLKHVTRLNTPD
ncbi:MULTISPECIES: hypothetical protein [Burkholderia cepacia complex]|nr:MULTISPECIES: hypothetical protein [Burkholderia cepacia complex]